LVTTTLKKKIEEFETSPMKITKTLVISWLTWLCIFVAYLWQMPLVDDFESILTALFGLHTVCP